MRMNVEQDPRLLGGIIRRIGNSAGVLYNADGHPTEALATHHNITVAVLTRNRSSYLRDLLQSVDASLPSTTRRIVLINNTEDDTRAVLTREFPSWGVEEVRESDFPSISPGLAWLRANRPSVLPRSLFDEVSGYGPTHSIAWLKNWQLRRCRTRFLVSLDDDMLVKPGWLDYLLTFQNRLYAYAVINNFGAYLMDTAVVRKVGWFDERYLRSHGFEDNDYVIRMNEAKLRWVLGFNVHHDWRSAEEGNPRGSGSGSDLFVHRYAKMSGGFSASGLEHQAASKNPEHFGNWCWYRAKWSEVREGSDLMDRPPFKGYFLKRLETEEPAWYPEAKDSQKSGELLNQQRIARVPGRKPSQNTPLDQIDPFERPETITMVDRYVLFSHWCKGKRVLDAGCGHGYGTALLYALGAAKIVGVDMDESALEFAHARYGRDGLAFEKADLLRLPEAHHGQYDTVVCVEVFEHISREEAISLVGSLRKALRPGGTLILTTPRRKTPQWNGDGGTHLYEYSPQEFKEALEVPLQGARLQLSGIREFMVEGGRQWFSRWEETLSTSASVMVAIAQDVPQDTSSSTTAISTSGAKCGGSTPLPRLSILLSNRNTLDYLKLAIKSCREYMLRGDHEIIVYDDASSDGSLAWLQENAKRYNLTIMSNPGPERKGIVFVYDELVKAATQPVVFIAHSDMFFARLCDAELWRSFEEGVVATCTRIEPPLYAATDFLIIQDFGMDPSSFQEEAFLRFAESRKDRTRTTNGIFAPLLIRREDYLMIGGHDKAFAPQSKEDSDLFNRLAMAGFRFVQSWSAFCYHFSGRGSRRKDTPTVDSEEWRQSNAKNERNFIRKWGASVRHGDRLQPIVSRRRQVSLVGLIGDGTQDVVPWVSELEPYVEEILLVADSQSESIREVESYMEQEGEISPLVPPTKLQVLALNLQGDLGTVRNAAQQKARFDWVLHVNIEERLPREILEALPDLIEELEKSGKTICGFPCMEVVNGVIVNDLPVQERSVERLRELAQNQPSSGTFRNSNVQFRLVRRDVRWTIGAAEVPEPVGAASDGANNPVAIFSRGCMWHERVLSSLE